jgi:hypothetical protein
MAPAFDPAAHRRVEVLPGSVVQVESKRRVVEPRESRANRYRLTDAERKTLANDLAGMIEDAIEAEEALELAPTADEEGDAVDEDGDAAGEDADAGGHAVVLQASIDPLEMRVPMQTAGREEIYASETASLTLRVEIREPGSDRVWMRFVEARDVRGIPSTRPGLEDARLYRVSAASNVSDIRRTLRRFSDELARVLARIVEAPPLREPA